MPTFYTATPRQVQGWKIDAHLRAEQPPVILRLDLPLWPFLSAEEVETAFRVLVRRHAALRTCFPMVNGQIVQEVVDYDPDTFQLLRLYADNPDLLGIYRQALVQLKDVTRPPLVRGAIAFGPTGMTFILLVHHLVSDAWSMRILDEEIQRLCYSPDPLPETNEYQLVDYFETRIEKAQTENLEYWMRELADKAWRTDFNSMYLNILGPEAGAVKMQKFAGWENLRQDDLYSDPRGYHYFVFLPESLFMKLAELCANEEVSFCSVLTACWALLGMELTGNKAILIRGLDNSRFDSETRNIVGNLSGETFLNLRLDRSMSLIGLSAYCEQAALRSANRVVYNSEGLEALRVLTQCFIQFHFLSKEMKGETGVAKIWDARTDESDQVWSPLSCAAEEFTNTIFFRCGYHAAYLDAGLVTILFDRYFDLLGAFLERPHAGIDNVIQRPVAV